MAEDAKDKAAPKKAKRATAQEVLDECRHDVEAELALVLEDLEKDDHNDPERYQGLKDERELLLDALNHHLTLEPVEEPVEEEVA